MNRTVRALAGALVVLSISSNALALVAMRGTAIARLSRGISTIATSDSGVLDLGDDDTTGVFDITNPHLFGAGIASSHLSVGAISSAAGSLGASDFPNSGSTFQALGSGDADYFDELLVTSSTLADGTPVTIMFSYHVAFNVFGESSFGPNGGNNNRALIRANITAQMRSQGFTGADIEIVALLANDHRFVIDTGSDTTISTGLFTGAQHVDVMVNAEVGGTILFSATTDADAIVNMAPFNNMNQTASATCQIGYAFGASGLTAAAGANDISIMSSRTGQTFPDASNANMMTAMSVLPDSLLPSPCCPGNADGVAPVNFGDITTVLGNWLSVTTPGAQDPGDANCDGVVDFSDITEVLGNWLNTCE